MMPALLVPAKDVSVGATFRDPASGGLFQKLAHDRRADVGLAYCLDDGSFWDVPGSHLVEVLSVGVGV